MNNNLRPSSKARCKCGRYMTLGEDKAGIRVIGYQCPDCLYRELGKRFEEIKKYQIKRQNQWPI